LQAEANAGEKRKKKRELEENAAGGHWKLKFFFFGH